MLLGLLLSLSLAQAAAVTGIVKDTTGGIVSGASVIVRTGSGVDQQTVSGPDGRFSVEVPDGQATLVVRAGGFAEAQQPLPRSGDIEVVLKPASLNETVTVTSTRSEQLLGNTPASVSVLDSQDIKMSPAVVADDVLRRIPTFSLFRRTSSISSHPTTQGVSLRGLGPSGTSRTLVLVDNVPFNDPFGAWVYWTRVPIESVDRIEVVDGSTSNLYGSFASGGVINIVSSRPVRRTVELRTQYGNLSSPKLDFFGSDVWGKLGFAVEGSFFDTNGFPIVIENERRPSDVNPGPGVDTKAWVNFENVNVKVDYAPTSRVSAFVRGGYFREERDNAKVTTIAGAPPTPEANDTTWKAVNGGVRILMADQSDLQARMFGDFNTFRSNTLAVCGGPTACPAGVPTPPQARSIGRITLNQRAPADAFGGMVQWSKAFGVRQQFTAGTDWRWVDGDSNEDVMNTIGTTATLHRVSGGTQRSLGAFVQDIFTPTDKLVVTVGARIDNWRNYDAHNLETIPATGQPAPGNQPTLPDKENTVGSPRLAALYHFTDRVTAWGDIGWGFRAPTLNELYRQFSVGLVRTLANPELGPERLFGGEAGLNLVPMRDMTFRVTWYDNKITDPIANATIATNTLQRQNLGRTRVRGVQTDLDYTIASFWHVSGGYLFNSAKVTENDKNPAVVGKYLPQVPKHRGSIQLAYVNPRIASIGIGLQFIGRQFDDDLNVRVVPGESEPGLPGYTMADFTASRDITRNFEAFFGMQNIFNEEYIVGTLPTTIGSPRLFHGGIRVRWTGR
jgi:outer membrane receptor protein involved in Fe transport